MVDHIDRQLEQAHGDEAAKHKAQVVIGPAPVDHAAQLDRVDQRRHLVQVRQHRAAHGVRGERVRLEAHAHQRQRHALVQARKQQTQRGVRRGRHQRQVAAQQRVARREERRDGLARHRQRRVARALAEDAPHLLVERRQGLARVPAHSAPAHDTQSEARCGADKIGDKLAPRRLGPSHAASSSSGWRMDRGTGRQNWVCMHPGSRRLPDEVALSSNTNQGKSRWTRHDGVGVPADLSRRDGQHVRDGDERACRWRL